MAKQKVYTENTKGEEIKLYRPSNGCEGDWFEHEHCMQCIHTDPDPTGEKQCHVWGLAVCTDTTDKEYPTEWRYVNDKPTCTKLQKWDWGNDDDGRNEPPTPEPEDPMQLLMPFGFSDLFKGMEDVVVTKHAVTSVGVLKELKL